MWSQIVKHKARTWSQMSSLEVSKRDAKIPGMSLKQKEAEQEDIGNKTEINVEKLRFNVNLYCGYQLVNLRSPRCFGKQGMLRGMPYRANSEWGRWL